MPKPLKIEGNINQQKIGKISDTNETQKYKWDLGVD